MKASKVFKTSVISMALIASLGTVPTYAAGGDISTAKLKTNDELLWLDQIPHADTVSATVTMPNGTKLERGKDYDVVVSTLEGGKILVTAIGKNGYTGRVSSTASYATSPTVWAVNQKNGIAVAYNNPPVHGEYYFVFRKNGKSIGEPYQTCKALNSGGFTEIDKKVKNGETYTYSMEVKKGRFHMSTPSVTITRLTAPKIRSVKRSGNKIKTAWKKNPKASLYSVSYIDKTTMKVNVKNTKKTSITMSAKNASDVYVTAVKGNSESAPSVKHNI